MSDDSVDPAGQPLPPPAPQPPSLPTLPSAAPRAPSAPIGDLWAGDREASDIARHDDMSSFSVPASLPPTPLTKAGTTVHRFSAAEMAEATRIKAVDNPTYGDLPKADAESHARADDLRRKAARTRARNKRLGWYMAIGGVVAVLAIFAVAYVLFQQEEDNDEPTVPVATTVPTADGATPLGEQITVINDANNAVSQLNGGATVP